MKNFFRKLFERLLARTESLQKKLDASLAPNDPLRKKMDSLVAKRDAYKRANQGKTGQSESLRKALADSLAAKKSALTPPKKDKGVKRPKRVKMRRGK
jgi:hypothetical protein